MDPFPSTRPTLLVRLRDPRNERAWDEFLRVYEPLVFGLARRRGLQVADAQDLCQDVFRSVAKAIDRYEPGTQGSFRRWLLKIARNVMLNHFSGRRRQPNGTGDSALHRSLESYPDPSSGIESVIDAEFRQRLFQFTVATIRPEFTASTWDAFWRTAVTGDAPDQIARELGLSRGAVYIAKSRVLARLREQIRELEGE